MAVDYTAFVGNFPEFADAAQFSQAEVTFWLTLATKLQDLGRWGDLYDFGQQLFTAHNLVLQGQATQAASVGGAIGLVQGAVTGGTVDKTSYTRDPGAAMDPKSGHWNLTTYGLRYIALVRMIGAGPVQIGVGCGAGLGTTAWPGVIPPVWG